ncbi:MAG TPA: hypothetical protein VKG84_13865 [Candidatus Acidoferrales bacterium]|nr:hypothetical protein [Candidatus Acidoferrales bacterium]
MKGSLNRRIAAELDLLVTQHILTPSEARRIAERYPTTAWDVMVLVRWFTILGAVTAGAGLVILANEYVNAMRLGEAGLAVATLGFIFLGRYLATSRGLEKTGAALEMAGGFALQGLTFLLAVDFSTGSKNWPALIGVQSALLVALAYALQNRLILIHAGVCFFIFFGGETGYASDWGAYWLALTYPLRFLLLGIGFLCVAWLHATVMRGPYQAFSRVYAHLGLLDIHLALWFLSVFGYFEKDVTWSNNSGERVAFSIVWGLVSVASLVLGGALGQQIVRSYGMTFLIINLYTFYFQFVVVNSAEAWWLHLLLVGGSLVWVGFTLERNLRRPRETLPPAQS